MKYASEDHHADFELSWGRAKVMIWLHKIDGLHESDFILAAKIDKSNRCSHGQFAGTNQQSPEHISVH